MDVYLLDPDADRDANLTLAAHADVDQLLERFDGRPMGASWSPLEVELIRDSRHVRIRLAGMFKVPQMVKSEVYVTDRFCEAVREHELTGLAWDRRLWSGD